MATSAANPRSSAGVRRASSTHTPPAPNTLARGATARSAVSPKVNASINGGARRVPPRPSLSSSFESDAASREALHAALKRETEEKEELLIRLQNKEQSLTELGSENENLTSSLNAAESHLAELYADQSRMEEETAAKMELVDRLRSQVQELEREKRDILRRYNEQTTTFDAERQSFYDNEQHLKSRIQSLVQARKALETLHERSIPIEPEEEGHMPDPEENNEIKQMDAQTGTQVSHAIEQSTAEDENEPAEMTSLRLELSTLSTSYASLQTTVQHLSAQLFDLKRVNNQLQEENESYNVLLREKTLSGQFDILKTVGTKGSNEVSDEDDFSEETEHEKEDRRSMHSSDIMTLDPVEELAEDMDSGVYGDMQGGEDSDTSSPPVRERDHGRRQGRGGRHAVAPSRSPTRKGESLADLPVAGPGLDLAAELGRAENNAILDGSVDPLDSRDRPLPPQKSKRSKRMSIDTKVGDGRLDTSSSGDIDALRSEVKSLKDANKALSLYASKIIDRIIAQEGFEHVLAVDYDKATPSTPSSPTKGKHPAKNTSIQDSPQKKPRPQSAIFRTFSNPEPKESSNATPATTSPPVIPVEQTATTRSQRRSLSFDWKPFSIFSSAEKKSEQNPNLRPLTLRPGASSVVGARKLDTHEDEEDRKERERMNATLKLMGIERPLTSTSSSPVTKDTILPILTPTGTPSLQQFETPQSPKQQTSRFSFLRTRSSTSDNSSVHSESSVPVNVINSKLTQEALERAEAETTLAALDEREKVLSAEISRGSSGGFTELPSRRQRGDEWRSRRSKRSGESGSGSTVWSAGMSTHREADSGDEELRAL